MGLLGFWVMRKKRLVRYLNDLEEGLYMELLDDGVPENLNLKRILNDFGCSHCFSLFLKFSSLKLVLTFSPFWILPCFICLLGKEQQKMKLPAFLLVFVFIGIVSSGLLSKGLSCIK